MKILIYSIILLFISSCAYPDIDSVPDFKSVELTKNELFDLCQLSSDVMEVVAEFEDKVSVVYKSEIERCIKKNQ